MLSAFNLLVFPNSMLLSKYCCKKYDMWNYSEAGNYHVLKENTNINCFFFILDM